MATSKSTFQKRQKEMKRQEKQRMKAERRAQKKLVGRSRRRFPDGTLDRSHRRSRSRFSGRGRRELVGLGFSWRRRLAGDFSFF